MRIDPTNEDSTYIKRKYAFIEVLRARLVIAQGFNQNNITTVPNLYRFTWTFLDGEASRIFDLKLTELRQETVANLIVVMNHIVNYFGPK